MEFLTRSASVRDRIRMWRAAGARVALVPTAGTLHKGHMSLVAEIRQAADLGKVRAAARELVILAAARLNSRRLTDNLRVRVIDRY